LRFLGLTHFAGRLNRNPSIWLRFAKTVYEHPEKTEAVLSLIKIEYQVLPFKPERVAIMKELLLSKVY
jgi:hypothetical protein